MVARLNGLYGDIFDSASFTLSQSYYYGSVNSNPLHKVELIEGKELDLHDELDKGAMGRDRGSSVEKGGRDGPYNEAGLIKKIMTGESYHPAGKNLLMHWAWVDELFGKSFLITDMSLTIAAARVGDHWLGHKIVRPGPILYVACEGHAGFWKRLKAKAKVEGWDEKTFPKDVILAKFIDRRPGGFAASPDSPSYRRSSSGSRRRRPTALDLNSRTPATRPGL
jgi:hypothetical protein